MKVQCPKCKEIIELEKFTTSDKGLQLLCTDCKRVSFIPNPENRDETIGRENEEIVPSFSGEHSKCEPGNTNPYEENIVTEISRAPLKEGEIECPKCGHLQTDQEACHLCGLDFSSYDGSSLSSYPKEAVECWSEVEKKPGNLDLHESFLMACSKTDSIDYATRQYRRLERDPSMKNITDRMKQRIIDIVQVQTAPIGFDQNVHKLPTKNSRVLLWVVAITAMLAGLAWIFYSITLKT